MSTPSHNNQDTPITLQTLTSPTSAPTQPPDINNVAWIAAMDPNNGNSPRMPQLKASLGAPAGTMVWWKLSVINHGLHGPTGNPYRDFDSGAKLTPNQISQLTNTDEPADTSSPDLGYSDDITVPLADGGTLDDNTQNGWVLVPAGTPWNIYQDSDWLKAQSLGFFGGDAVLSVKIMTTDGKTTVMPEQDYYFRIAGENPPADLVTGAGYCQDFINTTYNGPTPNWQNLRFTAGTTPPVVPGYWFAYAIAKEETDGNGGRTWYNQFLDNGGAYNTRVPGKEGFANWNNDGSAETGTGGYGLFQLTYGSHEPNFIMPRDWIWNWQSNVKQTLPELQEKLSFTQAYLNYIYTINKSNNSFYDPSSLTVTENSTSTLSIPSGGDSDPNTVADAKSAQINSPITTVTVGSVTPNGQNETVTLDYATTFNFWESSVILLTNSASVVLTDPVTNNSYAGAWIFTPASNPSPSEWMFKDNRPNMYLYEVTVKGIDNIP